MRAIGTTRWGESAGQVWVKSRVTNAPEEVRDDLCGGSGGL